MTKGVKKSVIIVLNESSGELANSPNSKSSLDPISSFNGVSAGMVLRKYTPFDGNISISPKVSRKLSFPDLIVGYTNNCCFLMRHVQSNRLYHTLPFLQ